MSIHVNWYLLSNTVQLIFCNNCTCYEVNTSYTGCKRCTTVLVATRSTKLVSMLISRNTDRSKLQKSNSQNVTVKNFQQINTFLKLQKGSYIVSVCLVVVYVNLTVNIRKFELYHESWVKQWLCSQPSMFQSLVHFSLRLLTILTKKRITVNSTYIKVLRQENITCIDEHVYLSSTVSCWRCAAK